MDVNSGLGSVRPPIGLVVWLPTVKLLLFWLFKTRYQRQLFLVHVEAAGFFHSDPSGQLASFFGTKFQSFLESLALLPLEELLIRLDEPFDDTARLLELFLAIPTFCKSFNFSWKTLRQSWFL